MPASQCANHPPPTRYTEAPRWRELAREAGLRVVGRPAQPIHQHCINPPTLHKPIENTKRSNDMKVKSSIRSLARKDGSYVVRRRGHLYVINKKNPHWKARQG